MLRSASGSTDGWRGPASGGARQDKLVGSRSLGGPSVEVVTSESGPSEKTLERRTRRTHYRRSCDSPGVTGRCPSRSPFDFACV